MGDAPALPYRDFAMPAIIAAQARGWLDTDPADRKIAVPRPSSTVMLLREGAAGEDDSTGGRQAVEVFVLRRVSSMPFAPGMVAFPGGGVDARDADPGVPWAGPTPTEWAQLLGTDEARARVLVIAAAREVFEECGVLLAGPDTELVVDDLTGPSWALDRDALLDRSQSFGEMLSRLGLVLRTDLLTLRAHWTTPECEPRRYDTRFFAARMPRGQAADGSTSEAEQVAWATPTAILAAQAQGKEILLPPTQVMLEQLSRIDNVEDLGAWLAAPVVVHPVMPVPAEHSGQLWMRSPIGADGHGLSTGVPAARD